MSTTRTQTPNPAILAQHVYASGAVGITTGQKARWNIVNPHLPAPLTGATRAVMLRFFSADGDVLKTDSVSLKPGESGSLELVLPRGSAAAVIHATAVVPITGPTDEPTAHGGPPLLPTLEVVDADSGRTLSLTEGARVQPEMQILRGDTGKA
jgi:hypothetical protein